MIILNIADYCHDCPDFTPVADRTNEYKDGLKITETVVSCKNEHRCRCIARLVKKQFEKEKEI